MNINPERAYKPRNPYRCRSYSSAMTVVPADDNVNNTAGEIMVSSRVLFGRRRERKTLSRPRGRTRKEYDVYTIYRQSFCINLA